MNTVDDAETIAAVATPRGRGGVGIIRISGPAVAAIADRLVGGLPPPRQSALRNFLDPSGTVLDQGLALYFPAPHSFTGEDVLELQGHGGPVVMDMVLDAVIGAGARAADPGEFSRRAFENDRIDLVQAEAIADLIDARSVRAAQLAQRTLQGDFSRRVHALDRDLVTLRVQVEAAVDFPEEELDLLADQQVQNRLQHLLAELQVIQASARQGQVLREGFSVAILGRPNAGKSTLLNLLSGRESAIVTEYAGTTRDLIREDILVDDLPVHIVDSAGLRHSADPVEKIGVERALAQAGEVELILYLIDDSGVDCDEDHEHLAVLPKHIDKLLVRTKIDKSGSKPGFRDGLVYLSAQSGDGVDMLRAQLCERAGLLDSNEGLFMARRRHLVALDMAATHLGQAVSLCTQGDAGDLIAEELRLAHGCLGRITGEFSSEDLLGEIFSSFCIGK